MKRQAAARYGRGKAVRYIERIRTPLSVEYLLGGIRGIAMNWEALSAIANLLAAIGVIVTLAYLAIQVRDNTKVTSAQSRHSLSEFILRISIFRAEHADRIAKVESGKSLTDGDRVFEYWGHMQVLLHAETYFHHHKLGLMPDAHWRGYVRAISGYIKKTPGFGDAWSDIGPGFSEDFAAWMNALLSDIQIPPPNTTPGAP